jgi:hypothetical protein
MFRKAKREAEKVGFIFLSFSFSWLLMHLFI